jgi:uncharacterized protein YdeI (YjbR/CyaY-like superfamily)
MPGRDTRIDNYIAQAQPFAQPILNHLRMLVHTACPEAEETMKWSFPHFDYKGEMMCSMAAFKQHCAFGFWKASLMKEKKLTANAQSESAMGHLGRITSLDDLPSDKKMIAYIKEAAMLNAKGIKIRKIPPSGKKKVLVVPKYFSDALKRNKKALATFGGFSYSQRKEYVEWVGEAKTEETREQRLATAVEWMAEGKVRNWKYLKK